jgi:AmmeMemoRadiSam system protein B
MQIEECFLSKIGPGELPRVNPEGKGEVVGLVSPHAGYTYSGAVASWGMHYLARDQSPTLVVILGPNHTGMGAGVSVQTDGLWKTPLGEVAIDSEAARAILGDSSVAQDDLKAHALEHSIEVQLPFLQYMCGSSFKIVPVCMLNQSLEASKDVGQAVAKALSFPGREGSAVIIASTDLTHYEDHQGAITKDTYVIEAIQDLSPENLMRAVVHHNISMCGPGPTAAMLFAAKELGATSAELLSHKTSGDTGGDYSAVVGYASMVLKK